MSNSLMDKLRRDADYSYSVGVRLANSEKGSGWEEKVRSGKFTSAEMSVHKDMWHAFGRYEGLLEAVREIHAYRDAEIVRLTAERDALRERCGRLASLVRASREYEQDCINISSAGRAMDRRSFGQQLEDDVYSAYVQLRTKVRTSRSKMDSAAEICDSHHDLKETTDG